MSAAMHFLDHSMYRTLCLRVREGILIVFLIEGIILIVRLRMVYALFGSLASLEIILLVAPRILSTDFFNPLLLRIDNKFKPSPSGRGFLFEGFF